MNSQAETQQSRHSGMNSTRFWAAMAVSAFVSSFTFYFMVKENGLPEQGGDIVAYGILAVLGVALVSTYVVSTRCARGDL